MSLRRILRGLRETLDYKFILALTVAIVVGYLILGGLRANHREDAKDAQVSQLLAERTASDLAAGRARLEASTERGKLLAQLERVLKRQAQLEARQAQLIAYLRAQGIDPPPEGPGMTPAPRTSSRRPDAPSSSSSPPPPREAPTVVGSGPGVSRQPERPPRASGSTPSRQPSSDPVPAPAPTTDKGPIQGLLDTLGVHLP